MVVSKHGLLRARPQERLLASASDKISASETLIRHLGPSEAYFWLSNQNSWKHFVVAAQITGETTTASWRTALDAGQRRHPLLIVCIYADDSGAPYLRLLPELRIPLQIVPGDALHGWEDEMETELSTPFPVEDALLVRAVLLHQAHRATILLTVHHSIADGLSVTLIVRDILESRGRRRSGIRVGVDAGIDVPPTLIARADEVID